MIRRSSGYKKIIHVVRVSQTDIIIICCYVLYSVLVSV